MMSEQLTAEQALVLDRGAHGLAIKLDNLSDESLAFIRTLSEMGMVKQILQGCYYTITDTGRNALATYKAQRDLVLFIAEFEERMQKEIDYELSAYESTGHLTRLERYEAVCNIAKIYRECKQRIEQPSDE